MRVAFDEFVFDSETKELRRSGSPVPLSPKAFGFLETLLRNRPRAVSKADLQDQLWPDTIVSESRLAKVASEVRKALSGEAPGGRYVRTVHGFGFAFQAPATSEDITSQALSACRLRCGDRDIGLLQGENLLGRDPEARVQIESMKASRHHARIVVAGTRAILEDLGSRNGTYLRGRLVAHPQPLRQGDDIRIGDVTLLFRVLSSSGTTEADDTD